MTRLNLGGGNSRIPGFISVDLYDKEADVKADITDLPYEDESVEEIVAYQVIEHIPYNKTGQLFREMWRVLKPGGTAIVECPDLEYVARQILEEGLTDKWIYNIYGEYHRPWDKERYEDWEMNASSIHRNGFTLDRIKKYAEPLGFEVEKQEMADKNPLYKYEENLSCKLLKPA